jgi:hypothetical protein
MNVHYIHFSLKNCLSGDSHLLFKGESNDDSIRITDTFNRNLWFPQLRFDYKKHRCLSLIENRYDCIALDATPNYDVEPLINSNYSINLLPF